MLTALILASAEFSSFVTLQRTTTVCSLMLRSLVACCRLAEGACGLQLGVDTARDKLLRIHLDLSFPALPCQGALTDLPAVAFVIPI